MKKIILFLVLLIPLNVSALDYPKLHYENAIVYDLTDNTILYEYNSDEKRSIASLTKLMTIITAIENAEDQTKTITYTNEMSKNVSWQASKVGFKINEELTFNDLLYGAMLPSGADATVALAYYTSGSLKPFIAEMNNLAAKIGMKNSNFVNVHGLDENNHYSTAEDISLLLAYALKNETFKKVYTTKEYTLSNGQMIISTVLKNSIAYDINISKIAGSKTGFTNQAGLAISVLTNYLNHDIIIVTLGAPTNGKLPYNLVDAVQLIAFINENYANQKLISKNTFVKKIPVEDSDIEEYEIKTNLDISKFLPNDFDLENVKIEYTGLETISYKNKKGDTIGTIIYKYKDDEIGRETVILNEEIAKDYQKIISKRFNNHHIIILAVILILIIIIIILIKRSRK